MPQVPLLLQYSCHPPVWMSDSNISVYGRLPQPLSSPGTLWAVSSSASSFFRRKDLTDAKSFRLNSWTVSSRLAIVPRNSATSSRNSLIVLVCSSNLNRLRFYSLSALILSLPLGLLVPCGILPSSFYYSYYKKKRRNGKTNIILI